MTARTRTLPRDFRERFARWCAADGRPLAEIARAAGLNDQFYRQLIAGHRKDPSHSTIRRALEGLGKRWRDLD